MDNFKINLCSMGDPHNPRTWSGTPFHLYSELSKKDQCEKAFNANIPLLFRAGLACLSVPIYGKFDINRGPISRYSSAFNVAITTQNSQSHHTLHTSTLSLPFINNPVNHNHYLYCDSTWNLWSRHATNMQKCSRRMTMLFDDLEKQAYAQVKHIFPISHYVKDNLVNYYGIPAEKITVVGTGLGVINPFHGEKDYSNRKILFVAKGRFKDKGGDLVMAAFEKALAIDPYLQLTIVGSEEAKKFESHPNINVLGFVSLEELQALFDSHSLFLMPAFNEPWGLVYLEAMVCKMPIMGLERNSFPELSGNGRFGFNITSEDPAVLGDAIVDAFSDLTRLHEMGAKAQAYCLQQFSWENTVNRMMNIIEGYE